MAAIITWLISFEKIWLRVVSAMTGNTPLGSQIYCKKSRMTILGLAGVLFCENEQAWTKWIIICSEENTYLNAREARGGLKATVGNRVKPDYHLTSTVLLFFSVSFSQILVFPSRLCSKACQHILDIVGLSHGEVWRTYLNLFNSHCYSFMKTNLMIIKA